MLALLIVVFGLIVFNGVGAMWYRYVTSDFVNKAKKGMSKVSTDCKRVLSAVKGEPTKGSLENAMKLYGLRTESEYYQLMRDNMKAIQNWVNWLRLKGYSVEWKFYGYYLDKISLKYEGTEYDANVFFDSKAGVKYVKDCIAFGELDSRWIEGYTWEKPQLNVKALLESAESIKYLNEVKEASLEKGTAKLDLVPLLLFESFDEFKKEITANDLMYIYNYIGSNFSYVVYLPDGTCDVSGAEEEL